MAADDLAVGSSDPDTALPGEAWTKLRKAWSLVRQSGFLPRFAYHFCFLFVVLAGLLVGRTVARNRSASPVVISSQPATASPSPMGESLGGVGGEAADVLLCAVVPHTIIPRRYRIDPITYTVQPGENVSTIAQQFGISVETILWNNGNLEDNPDYLDLGDVLTILPVSGVYHTVVEGDTLESIAQQYKAQVEDMISYEGNYMQEPYTVTVGHKVIVPGGRKPYKVRHVVAWSGPIPQGAKRGTGIFGWPMTGWISQRYHEYHPAADIAGPAGTSIKAADSGYVAVVGRNDTGYGRYVLIDHGNGFQTLYAHFGVLFVEVGQSVGKGQTIGLCGSTGKSTGPHVHFEIKLNGVRRNPLIYLK
jgi:murein DD-endopeptidase MepM/ murein hydrolase activator NlpD